MDWSSASEIVTGLALEGRLSLSAVRPELLIEPYNKVMKLKQKNPEITIEELIISVGFSAIDVPLRAVHNMNGIGEKDWVKILENSAVIYSAGSKLSKTTQKMMQGDFTDTDLRQMKDFIAEIETNRATDYVRLSDITDVEMPFIETGWEVWDEHLGGVPEVGMIIIGGRPGEGKTTAVGRLVGSFVKRHSQKKVALHSLEMMAAEIAPRLKSLMDITKEEQDRILICDKSLSVPEIISRATMVDDLGLVVIDFIDLAIDGVIDVTSTSLAYTQIAKAAKMLHCPIVVISQLTDFTGMPKPRNIRWSRLAWGLAWMVLMLYQPAVNWSNDAEEDHTLPVIEGSAYIIAWKIRGGFRKHPDTSPGAIAVPFNGKQGWSGRADRTKWYTVKEMD